MLRPPPIESVVLQHPGCQLCSSAAVSDKQMLDPAAYLATSSQGEGIHP